MNIVKSRWLSIKTDYDISEIFSIISKNKYYNNIGFINTIYSDTIIETTFVEKIKLTQYIVDPFGNESEQVIETYNHIELKFIENNLIEIISPPRSIKSLVTYIAEIFKHRLYISSLQINIEDVINRVKIKFNNVILKRAKASGVRVSENGVANIEVKSKFDAIEEIKAVSKHSQYKLDKVAGSIFHQGDKFDFEINNIGLISYSEDYFDFILNVFLKDSQI